MLEEILLEDGYYPYYYYDYLKLFEYWFKPTCNPPRLGDWYYSSLN